MFAFRLLAAFLALTPRAPRPARVAAVVGVALLSAPSSAQVETAPLRTLSASEQMAYRGVGRLEFEDGYCTATLFTETLALTAAHCVYDRHGGLRRTADMWFRAGVREGRDQALRQVRRIAAHPDYRWNGPSTTMEEIALDVALVELDQPLLTTEFPNYDPGELPPPGGAVALLSYGKGRDRALSLQEPCRVMTRMGAVAQLDCESEPGTSGSPVLAREPNGTLRLVGVVSAKGETTTYAAVASEALPDLHRAMDGLGAWRKASRPGDPAQPWAGGWKTSRPPAE